MFSKKISECFKTYCMMPVGLFDLQSRKSTSFIWQVKEQLALGKREHDGKERYTVVLNLQENQG